MVQRQDQRPPERIVHRDRHAGRLAQHRAKIDQGHFQPIDLALLQGRRRGCRVRLHDPFNLLEMCHLAARQEVRRLLARHVAVEPRIGRADARHPRVGQEAERSRADGLLDLFGARGFRHPLWHDEASPRRKTVQHLAERLLQPDAEAAVVEHVDIMRCRHQGLPERIAGAPASHRHHAVLRPDRFAVMECQPIAQGERPGQPIARYLVPRAHLRPRLALVVEAVQRVEHHVSMDSRDQGGRPDRIERRKAGIRNETQRPGLGVRQCRCHQRGSCHQ